MYIHLYMIESSICVYMYVYVCIVYVCIIVYCIFMPIVLCMYIRIKERSRAGLFNYSHSSKLKIINQFLDLIKVLSNKDDQIHTTNFKFETLFEHSELDHTIRQS